MAATPSSIAGGSQPHEQPPAAPRRELRHRAPRHLPVAELVSHVPPGRRVRRAVPARALRRRRGTISPAGPSRAQHPFLDLQFRAQRRDWNARFSGLRARARPARRSGRSAASGSPGQRASAGSSTWRSCPEPGRRSRDRHGSPRSCSRAPITPGCRCASASCAPTAARWRSGSGSASRPPEDEMYAELERPL